MSTFRRGLVVVAACTVTALVAGPAFQAANGAEPDTTSPSLTVQTDALVGSQLSTSNLLDGMSCDQSNDYTTVTYQISWNATDASGVSDYTTWTTWPAEAPNFRGWWSESNEYPARSFTGSLRDYDGSCGGGSLEQEGWAISAYDTVGNAKMVQSGPDTRVIQEDGVSATAGTNPSMFTYSGTWSSSTCTCASGGRQVWSKQLGASVSFTTGPGEVALVMAKGPGRGQADIYVDGSRVGTVDTRAATNTNRIVVWTRDLGTGTHTIRIRNLATAGRPRIDFDAIVLS